MKIRINGTECQAQPGEFLMAAARRNNIQIPSLCHHDALPGQACCRLCIVEVEENGKSKVVTSCVYPINCEIDVKTDSEKIRGMRRTMLMLLAAQAPQSDGIRTLAGEYGVGEVTRFSGSSENCVLCNLCVAACDSLGTGAITTANRGAEKKVTTPFDEPAAACTGCAACAEICPTGAIAAIEDGGKRTVWNKEFELVACTHCGVSFATKEQLEDCNRKLPVKLEHYGELLCEKCRQISMAGRRHRKPV